MTGRDFLKDALMHERDTNKGISYRCYMERPLTEDEIRAHAILKEDEKIDEIPDVTSVNVVITAQSEVEAEDWCRERMPDTWEFITTETYTQGQREIP